MVRVTEQGDPSAGPWKACTGVGNWRQGTVSWKTRLLRVFPLAFLCSHFLTLKIVNSDKVGPSHSCVIHPSVWSGNPPWALSVPACSCWVTPRMQGLTTHYSGHSQRVTLRDEVTSSSGTKIRLAYRYYNMGSSPSSVFLFCNALHCTRRYSSGPSASPPWDLEGIANRCKIALGNAACCAFTKYFVSDQGISCLLPASMKQ